MKTCQFILNNDNSSSFTVRPSGPSRHHTPTISYTHQQFHPCSPSARQCHKPHGNSSIIQSGSPSQFHVNFTLSNHAMVNHFHDQSADHHDSIHYSHQTQKVTLKATPQHKMILEELQSPQLSLSETDNFRTLRTKKKNKYSCSHAASHSCTATFTTSDHAAQHGKKHTSKKSVHCPICNKTFTQKDNMKQHQQTHHTCVSDNIMSKRDEDGFCK